MQTAARINRVFTGGSSGFSGPGSEPGSLQHILLSKLAHAANSHTALTKLADLVTRLAERAYTLRDVEALQEISLVLVNLPVAGARESGLYYQALACKRAGFPDKAKSLLEAVSSNGPHKYRARSIQSLGAISQDVGDLSEALRFQIEALRAASSEKSAEPLIALMPLLDISAVKSLSGDHEEALRILESISPLVAFVAKWHPFYFYLYHNELAVELGELGRLEEAMASCAVALRFPFASAYPEWTETRNELEAKRVVASSSFSAVNPLPLEKSRESQESKESEESSSTHKARKHHRDITPQPKPIAAYLLRLACVSRPLIPAAAHYLTAATITFATAMQFIRERLGESFQSRAPPFAQRNRFHKLLSRHSNAQRSYASVTMCCVPSFCRRFCHNTSNKKLNRMISRINRRGRSPPLSTRTDSSTGFVCLPEEA